MTAFLRILPRFVTTIIMDHNTRITKAIADLEAQNRPNIAATAKKWQIARETLSKRFRGETGTREEANSSSRQKLTAIQEKTLVAHINKLSERGLPPTPQIVRNLAKELAKTEFGKNWVTRFCKRNASRLSSVYLRTIDHKRKIADNSHHFEHYFNTVSVILACVRSSLVSYTTFNA
jgi:hypothetical protein